MNLDRLHIDQVQDLIGKPHERGARGPDSFDCWGLCVEVYRRAGITLPDYTNDGLTRAQTVALIEGHAEDCVDWIAKPVDWCFVFDRRGGHVGLFWRGRVLHCARIVGCVLQRFDQFEAMNPSLAFARWRA
jgi:hypothetical protein